MLSELHLNAQSALCNRECGCGIGIVRTLSTDIIGSNIMIALILVSYKDTDVHLFGRQGSGSVLVACDAQDIHALPVVISLLATESAQYQELLAVAAEQRLSRTNL